MERAHFEISALPVRTGVYLLKDSKGDVLYVGKAASLRHRVKSYFSAPQKLAPKIRKLAASAQDLDFIITDSEQEALILEANLIKKYHPRYNVRLKDDKSYPYIKVSLNEAWPRVYKTRRFEQDGGRYFGPYASARSVNRTLDVLRKLFRFCSPRSVITGKKSRPCFDFYIGRCVGACSGEISKEEYREIIDKVVLFLEGKQEEIVRDLKRRMEEAAEAQEFEKAAQLRDQLQAVESITEGQKISAATGDDEDVIAVARDGNEACVQIFFVRGGKLVGKEHFIMEGTQDEEQGSILSVFVRQFYGSSPYVPQRIMLQAGLEDEQVISVWLSSLRGGRVEIKVPQRGDNHGPRRRLR